MIKKIVVLILVSIGIILRIYQIDKVPAGFFADEIALGINAKTIAENGTDEFGNKHPFGFESFSDYKLPGYIYTASIFYTFLGPEMVTVRLPAVISSIISVFLIGYFAFILFPKNKSVLLLAMAILALSPYHLHFSRISFETMLATTFLLAYLVSVFKAFTGGSKRWIVIGALSLLASSWTYPAPRFIIPTFTLIVAVLFVFLKNRGIERRKIARSSVIFLLFIFISFIPSILNPEMDKRTLGYVFSGEGNLLADLMNKSLVTLSSYLRIWNLEFLFMKGDLFGFRHGTGEAGMFLSIFLLPLFVGIIHLIRNLSKKEPGLIYLIVLTFVAGLPSSLTSSLPYGPRLLPMVIPLVVIAALGTDILFRITQTKPNLIKYPIYTVVLIILGFQIFSFSHVYFIHFAEKSLPEFLSAPIQLGKDLRNEKEKNIYFLNGKNCWLWGYDELKLWYFADLDNKDMIAWNRTYRKMRFDTGNPFGSYDYLQTPRGEVDNIILNPSIEEMLEAPKHSLLVRCGIHFGNTDPINEKLVKKYYLYERQQRDIVYFVNEKL